MKSTLVSNQIMVDTKLHMLPKLKQYLCAVKAVQVNKLDIKGIELNGIKCASKVIADSDNKANMSPGEMQ